MPKANRGFLNQYYRHSLATHWWRTDRTTFNIEDFTLETDGDIDCVFGPVRVSPA